MLAEPRRKVKYSVDPRNTNWANDDNKFGQKLMERMGWSKGEGLGANRDGNPESVAVAVKNDNKGVGWNKNSEDNWIAHQDDFNSLLSSLNQNHGSGDGNGDKVLSLEQTSRSAKGRVHYQKFTKGKDLSLKTEKDLDCVFGKRKSRPKEEKEPDTKEESEPSPEEKEDSSGLNTVTSTDSIQDYFAKKMAALKNKRKQPNVNNNVGMSEYDEKDMDNVNMETNVDDNGEKKGKKRKYQDFAYGYEDTNSVDNADNVANSENEKDGKVKKKRKSVRFSIGDEDTVEPNCDAEHSADVESDNKKKKKKSKKKKKEKEEIYEDVETNLNDSSAMNESVNDTAVDSDSSKVLDNDNELGEVSIDSENIENKSSKKKKSKKASKREKEKEQESTDVPVSDAFVDENVENGSDNAHESEEISVDSENIENKSSKKKKSKKASNKEKKKEQESTENAVSDAVVDVKAENDSECNKVSDNAIESEEIIEGSENIDNKSSKKKKSKKASKKDKETKQESTETQEELDIKSDVVKNEKEIKHETQEVHTPDMKRDKERNKRNKKRKLMEEGSFCNETENIGLIEVNKETAEEMDCGVSDSPTLKKEKKKKRKKAEIDDGEVPEKKMKIETTKENPVIEDAELVNPFPNRNAENILLKYATDNNLEVKFIMATSGPAHRPVHTMHAEIGDRKFDAVQCKQKKEAQKKAAISALCVLNKEGAFDEIKEQETKKEEEKKKSKSEKNEKNIKVKEEVDSTGKTKKKKGKDKGKKDKKDGHASKFFPGSCLDDVEGYAGLAFLPVAKVEQKQKMKIKKKRSSGYYQKKK